MSSEHEAVPRWTLFLMVFFAGLLFAGLLQLLFLQEHGEPIQLQTVESPYHVGFTIFGAVATPGSYVSDAEIRVETAVGMAGGFTEDAALEYSALSAWVRDGDTVIIPTKAAVSPTLTLPITVAQRVDLNSADAALLMSLPGIGEKKAADIIALRQQKGGFQSVDEIMEVKGINQNLLDRIYDRIFVK